MISSVGESISKTTTSKGCGVRMGNGARKVERAKTTSHLLTKTDF